MDTGNNEKVDACVGSAGFVVVACVVVACVVVACVVVAYDVDACFFVDVYLKRLRIVLRCAKAGCGRLVSSS